MQLADREAREEALNKNGSYIVQAPAGSGKTALLTQRFLSLLSIVNHPQEIIALTFTKKAASEMRTRIIEALRMAEGIEPQELYLLKTYELAKKVIEQDKKHGWDLINKTSQLKIQTLDSLCHYITSRMPLLSKSIPYTEITDDPFINYREAAARCIDTSLSHPSYRESAMTFLSHLGNHRERIIELLALMLSKRDQWLFPIMAAKSFPKTHFEKTLLLIKQYYINDIKAHFHREHYDHIERLLSYQASFITDPIDISLIHDPKKDSQVWSDIGRLLLTSQGEWRKRFTIKEGFPPQTHFKTAEEKAKAKEIKTLLNEFILFLENNSTLKKKWFLLSLLPENAFDDAQWGVLNAMLTLLPILVAELQLIFSENATTDFIEIALQANHCLGDEIPTDLTLYLDNKIQHLLVDEFQDTSISQFSLIEKLIAGWENDDGRTLFIVGDPMQSIYRFRQADVSLFIKAKKEGIGSVNLKSLQLSSNFRSDKVIIDWVNQSCHGIFPKQDSIETGAISYAQSNAIKSGDTASINSYLVNDLISEANHITEVIKQHPNKSIAILVSSRNQLVNLMPILKKNKIAVEGVDLQALSEIGLIETLQALTLYLLDPNEPLHLSCLLVSPLCGIDYDSLALILAKLNNPLLLPALLSIPPDILPKDVYSRMMKVATIIQHHLQFQYRKTLLAWVRECFMDLSGELLLETENQDVNQFWDILSSLTMPIEETALKLKISKLYSKNTVETPIQVMTIHKSKGLEFDVVILPSIHYQGRNTNTPLLEWMDFLDKAHHRHLLLSPIKSSVEKEDKLYQFIRLLDKEKTHYEKQRLLYVALTRAKSKLFLYACAEDRKEAGSSFYAMLSPYLTLKTITPPETNELKKTLFKRLPAPCFETSFSAPDFEKGYPYQKQNDNQGAKMIGTVIHETLYYMTRDNRLSLNEQMQQAWAARLKELGMSDGAIPASLNLIQTALNNILSCPRGKWILSRHMDAESERPISTRKGNYIIDRTFIDNQTHWIIDYKTTRFSERPPSTYVTQLENYAEIYKPLAKFPIKLGLYFLLDKRFIEWTPGYFTQNKSLEMSGSDL